MTERMKLSVNAFESFGSVDGPGIRFVIFLQGCRLRCKYCHNPETWTMKGGTLYSVDEILDKAERYKEYWGKEGGITVSGGEPLLQLDALTELFREAKKRGINTCIDTAGEPYTTSEPFYDKLLELIKYTDLVLFDLKEINDEKHIDLTGKRNGNILKFAHFLSDNGVPMWIRHVLVPGYTDSTSELLRSKQFIDGLKTVKKVEVLPYHALGVAKYDKLKIPYPLRDLESPSWEKVKWAENLIGAGIKA